VLKLRLEEAVSLTSPYTILKDKDLKTVAAVAQSWLVSLLQLLLLPLLVSTSEKPSFMSVVSFLSHVLFPF